MLRWKVAPLCAVLLMGLVACGGGGGGSSGGGSPSPSAPGGVPTDVSLRVDETMSMPMGHVLIGSPALRIYLSGVVQGNAASLNGRTIYAVVEDKDGLIQGAPIVSLGAGSSFSVALDLKTNLAEGLRTGALKISACLDLACTQQLAGSPLSYPYQFKWVRQLAMSPSTQITASRVYGSTGPVKVDFQVTASVDSTLTVKTSAYEDPDYGVIVDEDPRFTVSGSRPAGTGTWSGSLQFQPAAPGVHTTNVSLQSTEPGVAGLTYPQHVFTQVRYEVIDDPAVAMAFAPTRADITLKADRLLYDKPNLAFRALARAGDTLSFKSIRYLTAPTAAAALPMASNWLAVYAVKGSRWALGSDTMLCWVPSGAPSSTACLPAGTYTAVVLFDVRRSNGTVVETSYPVTLEIQN